MDTTQHPKPEEHAVIVEAITRDLERYRNDTVEYRPYELGYGVKLRIAGPDDPQLNDPAEEGQPLWAMEIKLPLDDLRNAIACGMTINRVPFNAMVLKYLTDAGDTIDPHEAGILRRTEPEYRPDAESYVVTYWARFKPVKSFKPMEIGE